MARRPPHRHAQIPAAGGPRVLHQALDQRRRRRDAPSRSRASASGNGIHRSLSMLLGTWTTLIELRERDGRARCAPCRRRRRRPARRCLSLASAASVFSRLSASLGHVLARRAEQHAAVEMDARAPRRWSARAARRCSAAPATRSRRGSRSGRRRCLMASIATALMTPLVPGPDRRPPRCRCV